MTNVTDKQEFGRAGAVAATAGAIAAGDYCSVLCLTACNFSVFTSPVLTGAITGVEIPAGVHIKIPFTGATLTSGTAIAFKSVAP